MAHVSKQLVGFKKFGSGGKLLIFDYNRLTFDYTPYAAALHQASTPEVITNQAPTLVITSHTSGNFQTSSNTLSLAGYAKDDLAIKAVRWSNDRGGSGATPTNWQVFSKYDYASFISYYQTGYETQREFRDTNVVARAKAKGVSPTSTFKDHTHIDFIDGLTSVNGYAAFNLSTETFYKDCYYISFPCDNVLQEHANKLYSLLSRRCPDAATALLTMV